jgi:DNA-directed RNA polymerase specialized sigma24 family protein
MQTFEDFPKKLTGWIGHRDDDLVQEGLIAAWLAQESHPGESENYYWTAAKNRVRQIMRGEPYVGSTRERGHWPTNDIAADPTDGTLESFFPDVELDIDSRLDIERALDSLPDDEYDYVLYRFYWGMGHEAAWRAAGVKRWTWQKSIKRKLANILVPDST